ncbi:MAG: hypothetical protein H0T45_13570 [Pyrinomonadaceae bacterium]|nr:hypothetical protein [Pyrinomonadaceae bacterium]
MAEHFTEQHVERYRSRLMSPAELLAADDHLAVCEACRLKTAATVRAAALLISLRHDLETAADIAETNHLSYEQIAALIDEKIIGPERTVIEEHRDRCASCAAEVRDLFAFKSTLATKTAAADPPTRAATPSITERVAAFWRWPAAWWAGPPFATAAVVLVAVAATIFMLLVLKPTEPTQTELAQSSPSPPIVQPSSSPATSEASRLSTAATPDKAARVPLEDDVPLPATDVPAEMAVALNDGGGRVTLDRRGNLTGLVGLSPSSQQAVKKALTSGAVATPRGLTELARGNGTLMGSSGGGVAFPLVSPVGVVVRSERPTLRWRPLSGGATGYTVTLLDANLNAVATSPLLDTTEWTVPRALARGASYTWQVTAVKDGREIISPAAPAPEARFKILEPTQAAQLRRLEAAHPTSHLARGVSYAQAGLLDDAAREFRALLAANPQSDIVRKLLRDVEARRRRPK